MLKFQKIKKTLLKQILIYQILKIMNQDQE